MRLSIVCTLNALTLALVSAHPHYEYRRDNLNTTDLGEWKAPGLGDFRSPCPMMNTLANHGYIPRDGRDITLETAVYALTTAISFDEVSSVALWRHGVKANPAGANSTSFTLEDLGKHNLIEHDASMSRADAYFGNSTVFNQTVFDTTKAFWTAENLTVPMLARANYNRQIQSAAYNPEYTFNSSTSSISLGAVSTILLVFGDFASATVNRTFLTSFFENVRLPSEYGWKKRADPITLVQLAEMSTLIQTGESTITASDSQMNTARDVFSS